MLYVFLVLALLASCALTWAASGFATLHALWQVPVFFAGRFLALVLLFLLVVLISCLFVDPKKLLEKPWAKALAFLLTLLPGTAAVQPGVVFRGHIIFHRVSSPRM